MHTIELLREALALLEQCGYTVRQEWLDGGGSGACRVKGRKWFFLDLALAPDEQLELAADALRGEPEVTGLPIPRPLCDLLNSRKAA